jgi:hypothetical protein
MSKQAEEVFDRSNIDLYLIGYDILELPVRKRQYMETLVHFGWKQYWLALLLVWAQSTSVTQLSKRPQTACG